MESFWVSLIERESLLPRLFPDYTIVDCLITALRDSRTDKVPCTLKIRFRRAPRSFPSELFLHLGGPVPASTRHEASDIAVIASLQNVALSKNVMGALPRVLQLGRLNLEDGSRLDYFCEDCVPNTVSLDSVLGEISESDLSNIADAVVHGIFRRESYNLRIDSDEILSKLLNTPLNPVYDDGKSYGGWIGGPHLGYHNDTASLLKRILEPPQARNTHNPLVYSMIACLDLDGFTHVVIDSTRYPDLEPIHLTSKDLKNLYTGSVLCHYALHEPRNILVRKYGDQFQFVAIVGWKNAGFGPAPLELGLLSSSRGNDCAWSRMFQSKAQSKAQTVLSKTDSGGKLLRAMMLVQQAIDRDTGRDSDGNPTGWSTEGADAPYAANGLEKLEIDPPAFVGS
ncbi:hypothetical protein J7T55_001309 [Diaporthe amygdali]|uniref:uncharacterized protein n=1 Tax=Phomopsis amygdali TaxID=1214568 RepID=UPI0022FEAF48|nr:uncharacterized protein J7T55_001309 [Diaporthe amygdali]KAJ0106785.1 hypothetical protein J7T55_001309 [Diaporthe amygdali]